MTDMDTIEAIYHDFSVGDLGYIDAIKRVEALGCDPKEAEQIVGEWADALEGEVDDRDT